MKKTTKFLIAGLLSVTVLAGAGYALTAEDSLVTLHYVNDTAAPAAEKRGSEAGNKKLQETYNAGKAKLDQVQNDLKNQCGSLNRQGPYSASLAPVDCHDGQTFELVTGGSALLQRGTAVVSHNGAFIDATSGTEVKSGRALENGHRYLTGENTTARVTVVSGIASLGVQGDYRRTGGNPHHLPFYDISHLDWFYSDVAYVYEKNYFAGISETEFGPGVQMSRAMVVTVLYKLAGQPADELAAASHHSFRDVPEDMWYAPFIKWGFDQKITSGTGPDTFSPDDLITREQFVQLLYNFSVNYLHLGPDQKGLSKRGDLDVFEDCENVSSWASDAVAWGVGTGLLKSMRHDSMILMPQWSGDRVAAAGMLYTFDHLE